MLISKTEKEMLAITAIADQKSPVEKIFQSWSELSDLFRIANSSRSITENMKAVVALNSPKRVTLGATRDRASADVSFGLSSTKIGPPN